MSKRYCLVVVVIVIVIVMLLVSCSSSVIQPITPAEQPKGSQVIKINVGDNIQQAVDKAQEGWEIVLAEGRYLVNKPVVVKGKKNLTITGAGEVWVESKRTDHQIFYLANSQDITLRNIKAQHISKGSKSKDSTPLKDNRKGSVVDVEGCTTTTFENCELVGCGIYGIYASNTNKVNVIQCYLHHNSINALGFINKKGATEVLIKDCRIVNNTGFMEKAGDIVVTMDGSNVIENNNPSAYQQR